ncbi:hypothetical protein GBA52_028527 [Prunus armeniaca]|nr:hypothetical protein GBA52_028527 [Prunus armeniaca]
MWTMGTDFKYQYAHTWFRQMDKLIHYVNKDGRVNALYSTPSIYTDAKYATNESWPIKTDDFFPANTDSLADALAIAQHHDAVTGTEKQHVANDYAKKIVDRLHRVECLVFHHKFQIQAKKKTCVSSFLFTFFFSLILQCPLLNISYCPAAEVNLSQGKQLIVVVYNSLGWKRNDVINEDVTVQDSEGREIESQLLPLDDAHVGLRNYYVKAYLGRTPTNTPNYWLAFTVSVPPLGFSTYTISYAKGAGACSTRSSVYTFQGREKSTVEVGQGNVKLTFSTDQGKMTNYFNRRSLVQQSYSFYTAYNGSSDKAPLIPQNSGAYVFRPNGTFLINPGEKVCFFYCYRGPIIDEVHQHINSWIYQITRLHKEKEHVEVEFIVGPIPIDDGTGKEFVTQIATTMATNKTFYTDSNGRDFIKRIRDYRTDWDLKVHQPLAGNYYPINLGIYMQDNRAEFSVLVDRSIGGSSTVDGQIDLMLHRHDGDNWKNSHVTTFSGVGSSYSLPDNVALITLQVIGAYQGYHFLSTYGEVTEMNLSAIKKEQKMEEKTTGLESGRRLCRRSKGCEGWKG